MIYKQNILPDNIKMKAFQLLFILGILVSCGPGSINNSLKDENLQGKVKSIKEYWLGRKAGSKKLVKTLAFNYLYNPKGFITESGEYGENDSLVGTVFYNYDENSRLLSKKSVSGNGTINWRLDYSYFESDSIVMIKLKLSDKQELKSTNYRFINGQILNPFKENKLQFEENFYDESGNLIEVKFPDSKSFIRYNYSDKLLTEVNFLDDKENIRTKEIYKYDKNRNLEEKQILAASGNITSVIKYQYYLDSKGNWIKKREFSNKKLVAIMVREIEYY